MLGSVVRVDPNADKGDALFAQKLFNYIKPKVLRSEDQEKKKQNRNTPPREEGSEN